MVAAPGTPAAPVHTHSPPAATLHSPAAVPAVAEGEHSPAEDSAVDPVETVHTQQRTGTDVEDILAAAAAAAAVGEVEA